MVAAGAPASGWAASGRLAAVVAAAKAQTQTLAGAVRQTRVVADPSAPGNQRPTVLRAPNGTPLVNIQTPSTAGVSRNTYGQFDLGPDGVILNNSRTDVSTQLGGWVQGNPWMGRGEARVILNEVNSSAPSQLHGYVEVAGRRAEVIIANPAGIQVDGGGFINASSATLTTGMPRLDAAGNVSGLAVQGGLIRIDGAGLDGSSTDYTALLSRAVELNAGFWAKNARIQTGTQVMSAETAVAAAAAGSGMGANGEPIGGETLPASGDRPRYALDSTALGGIYAQRITLVGTEAGLGVRQAGQMVGGQLTLRLDGWLDNTGSVYAQQADASGAPTLQVSSGQGVRNGGWMAAQGGVAVTAPQLQSTAVSVTAAGMAADGTVGNGPATLTLTASGSQQQSGQLLAPTLIDVQAPSVDLIGAQARSAAVAVAGDQVSARGATLLASDSLSVTARTLADLSNSQAQATTVQVTGGDVRADGAALSASGGLEMAAGDRLSASRASLMADTLRLSAHQADLSGGEFLQMGSRALTLGLDGALTADGARIATHASDLSVSAASISARDARFEHYGTGSLSLRSAIPMVGHRPDAIDAATVQAKAAVLDLSGAQLMTGGRFALVAGTASLDRAEVMAPSVDWITGQLSHQGGRTQVSGTEASRIVSLGALDNRLGRIESNSSSLTLQGAVIDNRAGLLSSVGNLSLDGQSLNNQAGVLLANQTLTIGAVQRPTLLDNSGGQLGAADVALTAAQVLNAGGLISATQTATVDAAAWQHGDGRLEATTLAVDANRWEGAGTVYARGQATFTAGLLQTAGVLGAGGALQVRAGQVFASGLIAAGLRADGTLRPAGEGQATTDPQAVQPVQGGLTLQAAALSNAGALQSSGAVDVDVTGDFNNTGSIYAYGAAAIRAGHLINPGTVAAQSDLTVSTDRLTGGGGLAAGLRGDNTLAAQGTLNVTARQQLEFSGAMTSVGELSATGASLQLQGAQLQSRTVNLRATEGDLSLDGSTVAANGLSLSAGQDLITSRALISAGQMQLAARDWINAGGRVTQTAADGALVSTLSRDLNNQNGIIESTGRTWTLSAATVNNTAGRLAQAGGDLTLYANTWNGAQGQVLAVGSLDWTVNGALTLAGATTQADAVHIQAEHLTHDGGQMVSGQATRLDVTGALSNQGGTLAAGSALTIDAGRVSNAAGGLMQSGSVLEIHTTGLNGSSGLVGVDGLDNQGGRLRSGADMLLTVSRLDNRGGWAGSSGAMTVHTTEGVLNAQGSLLAQQALGLTAGMLDNQQGRIASGGGAVSLATAGLLDNTQGSVLATGALTVQTSGLTNARGELSGTTVFVETQGQAFNNRAGKVLSSEAMTVRSGALDNFGGLLQSSQTLTLQTGGAALTNTLDASVLTPTGLRSQGTMQVDAGAVENSAGIGGAAVTLNAASLTNRQAVSGQTLALHLAGTLDNSAGQLVGLQSTNVTAGDILNQGGLIYGGHTLDLRASGLLDNRDTSESGHPIPATRQNSQAGSQGLQDADWHSQAANEGIQGGTVTVSASQVDNRAGQFLANTDLRITATESLDNSGGVLSGLGRTVLGDGRPEARSSVLRLTNASGRVWGGTGLTVSAASLNDSSNGGNGSIGDSGTGTGGGGGEFSSGGSLSLTLGGDLTYGTGTLLQARGDIGLTLGGNFINEGVLRAGGALDIQARDIDNRASGELSGAETRLTVTQAITNRGLIDGERVTVAADQLNNLGTGRIYGSDLTLAGGQLTNGAENGQAAVIASRGDLTIHMSGAVSNSADALVFADGDLRLTAASVDNTNATLEATRILQMDVSGAIHNRSIHDGAEALPQDPNAPQVLASKAFISSGGDMRLTTGQLMNSGATIEARGNLTLKSADIHNLNPYLKWQTVAGATTTGWEFQAPGSTVRYTPEQIRVLAAMEFTGEEWSSRWGSDAQGSLEPFVWKFHPQTSNWSQNTYHRKMLLPSERYPNEIFGRYLGGLGGDVAGSAARWFTWRLSADHVYTYQDNDGMDHDVTVPGAHYPASDRIWSDFGVTPGDDNALDAAVAVFFADANSRLVGDFTAFSYSRTSESAKVTQSAAGQIIVGGTLSVEGGRIVNDMSRIIGRDGLDIRSASIDNRSTQVAVSGSEHVDVYRTYNAGSSDPNTGYDYTTTDAVINGTVVLTLPELGAAGAGAAAAPGGRQQAGAVTGTGGAQGQSLGQAAAVRASDHGPLGHLVGASRQDVDRGEEAQARRAITMVRRAPEGLSTSLRPAATVQGFDASGRLRAVAVSLSLPTNSLFKLRTDTRSGYLVETDPRYANYRNWLSSDYLLQALAVDPATVQKRLGDGFYEQRLVREQVGQLTGSSFLQGYASDEAMYRDLLTNGASFASAHQLRPGVALTAEQMSQLTTDLVWLVEQSVTLADGSTQRVLVPQVYLMPRDGDLQASGALIAGNRVDIAMSGDLNNSGDLRASEGLRATAQNIVHSGSMRGTPLALSAAQDLRNLGGSLTATDSMSLKAGRDLVVSTTTASGTTATSQRTVLDRVASLTAGGVMVLQAGQDVVLEAARIRQTGLPGLPGQAALLGAQGVEALRSSGGVQGVPVVPAGPGTRGGMASDAGRGSPFAEGGILVQAGRDLKLTTVQTASSDRATFDANNHLYQGNSQQVGTSVEARGKVLLSAGQDLTAQGASVNSASAVQLNAERDVQLLAGQSTESLDEASKHKVKGFLNSTTTTTKTQLERTSATGTTISGDTVAVTAGQDIRVQGSNVVSDNATALQAGRDVTLENALDTRQSHSERQVVTKGLTGAGAGFSIGTRDQRSGQDAITQTVVASTVGSVGGDVSIIAGRNYSQVGSLLQTPKGDVDVLAQRISVTAAAQEGQDVQTTSFRQSGLSVSVSAPVISAMTSTMDMADNIGKVSDARMQALGAASTAIKAKEAVQALQADPKAAGGLSISITVGSSQSTSRTETTTTTHQGSEITAGGDIRLTAQGAGADSGIHIQGSDLAAAQRLALKAEGDVSLVSAQDRVRQKSSNSSSSAAVGVAMGVGSSGASIGITASASQARGKSDGEDVIQRNTRLEGQQVSIKSGGDTTLKGAVVSGDQVKVAAGGNLSIESLQDTSKFKSESMQVGGSATIGAGFSGSVSGGQSKIKSDYASVTEQSGIRAGDGGFQVEVKGHTDLQGGAITSTQAAVVTGVNSLDSGSLTLSDIQNKADYKGSSYNVSVGFGKKEEGGKKGGEAPKPTDGSYQLTEVKPGGAPGNSAGFGYSSGSDSSVTQAGISGVAGNTSARTGDVETGIKQIFDKSKVQQDLAAQVAITQTFGKEASQQVGDFAQTQMNEAKALLTKAQEESDPGKKAELEKQAAAIERDWGDHGVLRLAAHTVIGGLTGNMSGAAGAAAGTLTAPAVADALKNAGVQGDLAKSLTALASTAVGAAVGGGAAGGVTAFNEVTNNYLKHAQVLQKKAELAACKTSACRDEVNKRWTEISKEANNAALDACLNGSKEDCRAKLKEASTDLEELQANPDGKGQMKFLAESSNNIKQVDDKIRTALEILAYRANEEVSATYVSPAALAKAGLLSGDEAAELERRRLSTAIDVLGSLALPDSKAPRKPIKEPPASSTTKPGTSNTAVHAETPVPVEVSSKVSVQEPELPKTESPDRSAINPSTAKGSGADSEASTQAAGKETTEAGASCANPPQCFVAGTLIHTVDGPKPIEKFVGGELVLSRHEHTGEAGVRPVVATVATKDQPIYEVVIEDVLGNTETLHTTAEHPFWVVARPEDAGEDASGMRESQWVRAASLTPGMRLVDMLGAELIVRSQSAAERSADVFNVEIQEHHTYHVGILRVWAHNAPCCSGGNSQPEPAASERYELVGPTKPTNWDSLTSHPDSHALAVHGGAVTDDQLIVRARTGIKPDGSAGPIPKLASAFYSDDLLIETDQAIRSGGALARAIARQPGQTVVRVETQDVGDLGKNVGYGYARLGGTGNMTANAAASGPLQRVDGLKSAQGIYEFNPNKGVWETITVYPVPH
ncbi:hemagglutinin repeat-containing protein [Roseateles terrae]|uniref:Filamentous hemagglutinin n=1 Tax=Roseateles terrae TaxID=431060 RepID=A0ABR6GRD8_9BURK|nr:hemagglutinin repeat-containing protein [Roseateles terrae]MBB3193723.1 filamentous hemagglutinin [Roseateles terrae]